MIAVTSRDGFTPARAFARFTFSMRCVYQAENSIDAHLVRGALEQHGIPAYVLGDYLAGAIGELPVCGLVEVHVPDDRHAEAEAFVRELKLGDASELVEAAFAPKPA